jgi:hypothetical protein
MINKRPKTARMLLLELSDPQKRSIEEIMRDLYQEYGSQRGAATVMGITSAAFSQWVYRLGLDMPVCDQTVSVEEFVRSVGGKKDIQVE